MSTPSKVDYKVVLLGQERVGKTCIMQRFLYGRYKEQSPDTAGSERYEAMSRIYYKNAKAAIVCYDMTFAPSFKKVRFWVDQLVREEPECAIFIVGTKSDLIADGSAAPAVRKEELRAFATDLGLDESRLWETSAKTGANINDLFQAVAEQYKGPDPTDPDTVDPNQPLQQQQQSCPC